MFLNLCSLGLLEILRSRLVDEEESFRFFERRMKEVGIPVVFLKYSMVMEDYLAGKKRKIRGSVF